MQNWGITGHTGGKVRQSLTYNLKAGQFRGMGKPSIYQSNTYIKNNYYGNTFSGYDYGCCYDHHNCNGGGSNWLMGLAMGLPLIGNILEMFIPQKTATDGAGGGAEIEAPKADTDLDNMKTLYPEYNIVKMQDGKYVARSAGGSSVEADSLAGLRTKLDGVAKKAEAKANPKAPKTEAEPETDTISKDDFGNLFNDEYLNRNFVAGQGLKVDNKIYKTEIEAYKAYTNNAPVEVPEGGILNDILKNIVGVYDDGKDSTGKEIGDFTNVQATLDTNKEYKVGDEVKIGNRTYTILKNNGDHIYLEDKNPAGGPTNNKQVYILEKVADNKYELHQRPYLRDNDGVNQAATSYTSLGGGGGVASPAAPAAGANKPTANTPKPADTAKPAAANNQNVEQEKIIKENKAARKSGNIVRQKLAGYTHSKEYTDAKRELAKVDSTNVREFINGYEEHKGAATDHIIEEIWTEGEDKNFTSKERNDYCRKIIDSTLKMAKDVGINKDDKDYCKLENIRAKFGTGVKWAEIMKDVDNCILKLTERANNFFPE